MTNIEICNFMKQQYFLNGLNNGFWPELIVQYTLYLISTSLNITMYLFIFSIAPVRLKFVYFFRALMEIMDIQDQKEVKD